MTSTVRATKTAAIYVRVSDPKQRDNYSPETQEAACRQYAAERGYAVAEEHVYREVHTASELWQRPELARAREAIARGEVQALICHDVDRFSRRQVHTAILADECERAGARLLFALSEFEQSATGDFLRNAKAFAAELELEKIKERTMRGLSGRLQAGKIKPGARALYGYRWPVERREENGEVVTMVVRDRYEIEPTTAPVVQRIYCYPENSGAAASAGMA